jgi:methylase of polypeptide subunit release factors
VSDDGRDILFGRVALLRALKERDYRFITPTPLTHARVIARKGRATDLRDVLGWSLPFERGAIDAEIVTLLEAADALAPAGDLLKSKVRVSSLDDDLFLHSAYPTTQSDAVFFGPDSYRFAAFIRAEIARLGKRQRLADIGTGSGIGGIVASKALPPRASQLDLGPDVMFNDINPQAIEFAMANVMGVGGVGNAMFQQSDGLGGEFTYDLIVANPPYIIDNAHRAYRDGGGDHGAAVSFAWANNAVDKLERNGVLLLYTGSAIVNGVDCFKIELEKALRSRAVDVEYRELDPDVFGEELEREEYADVERIAVVGVVATKR